MGTGPGLWHSTPLFNMKFRPKKLHDLPKACRPFFGCVPRAGLTSFRRKRNKQRVAGAKKHGFTTSRSHLPYPNHIRKSLRHLFFHSQLFFFLRDSVKPQKVWCMCSFGTTLPGKSSGKSKEHMLGSK